MKVAFTGAGGVGKTTLCNALSATLGWSYIPGVARTVYAELNVRGEDAQKSLTPKQTLAFQKIIIERKLQQDLNLPAQCLLDRTVIDHFAYILMWSIDVAERKDIDDLEKQTVDGLAAYDRIFYVPLPRWRPPHDPARTDDEARKQTLDLTIRGFLNRHNINYLVVPDLSLEERTTWCRNHLQQGRESGL